MKRKEKYLSNIFQQSENYDEVGEMSLTHCQ
jgi:hypothetical protein